MLLNCLDNNEYLEHKENRFRTTDEKNISKNEAFILSDGAVREAYKDAYERSSTLYYKEQISFDDIMNSINQNLNTL